ncbi:hypothetical protein, partial [Streptomyces adustus]
MRVVLQWSSPGSLHIGHVAGLWLPAIASGQVPPLRAEGLQRRRLRADQQEGSGELSLVRVLGEVAEAPGGHRPLLDRRRDARATVSGDLAEREVIDDSSTEHHPVWWVGSPDTPAWPGTRAG